MDRMYNTHYTFDSFGIATVGSSAHLVFGDITKQPTFHITVFIDSKDYCNTTWVFTQMSTVQNTIIYSDQNIFQGIKITFLSEDLSYKVISSNMPS